MDITVALIAVYSLLIVLASLAGGWIPFLVQLTHTRIQITVSLVSGLMLGVGLFHMLPHAIGALGSVDRAVWWMMLGLLAVFFLIRAFQFHEHEPVGTEEPAGHADADTDAVPASALHPHGTHDRLSHPLSWIGVACGLGLHTLIDGMALAASVHAEALGSEASHLFGLGTFLAILLHKPLNAVSITSLMATSEWSNAWRHAVNAGFALMCPLGAALFGLGVYGFADVEQTVIGCGLAFSVGAFLCISLGDLLPELEFHAHDRVKLSVALLLGIALAYAIGVVEPEHAHGLHGGPAESPTAPVHGPGK